MDDKFELRFEWQCPHCGHLNTAFGRVTSTWGTMETKVVYCDTEEGGCGCRVAVEPCAAVAAAVYKLVPVSATYALVASRRPIDDTDMTSDEPLDEAGEEFRAERKQAQEFLAGTRRGMGLEE